MMHGFLKPGNPFVLLYHLQRNSPYIGHSLCCPSDQVFGETLVSFGSFGPLLEFDMLIEIGVPR
jgi:hypothetical protein